MNRILRITVTVSAGCALALTTGSCARKSGPPQRPPATVQTAPALQLNTPVIIEAFGNTRDFASVDVVPQVSGLLLKTFIRDGAVVTNGQPLFLIDPRDYAARVAQAEGAVAADRANVQLNRMTVERNQPLLAKSLISSQDVDALKTHLEAAQAQLQADEAALELAQLNLARCTLRAPFDGICSRRNLDDGNLVVAGVTRLTNIRCYDPMYVDFSVSDRYLARLRKALAKGPVPITITPSGATNGVAGTLTSLDNAVDMASGTIALRGQVPNAELKLWAQQFVNVSVMADVIADAVMVPEGAVQVGKMGPFVFVAGTNGLADLRSIEPGVRYQNMIEIVSGVKPGESVVVLGQLMLYPGAPVAEAAAPTPANGPDAKPEKGGRIDRQGSQR